MSGISCSASPSGRVPVTVRDLIPTIDISALFSADPIARAATDRAIVAASECSGFMLITLPDDPSVGAAARSQLLRIFDLSPDEKRRLWRQKFDSTHHNVYRGWFPLQRGLPTAKEGIDLGPDIAYGSSVVQASDPLREATPLPAEESLRGWRSTAAGYYRGMARIANSLMRSIARGLGLPERYFDAFFERGLSTLRLIRYPVRDDLDAAGSGGRINATEHRVIGIGRERRSIPYFHEARAEAEISPLPLAGGAKFEPFLYGDYLWQTTTQFVEFKGMEGLRARPT